MHADKTVVETEVRPAGSTFFSPSVHNVLKQFVDDFYHIYPSIILLTSYHMVLQGFGGAYILYNTHRTKQGKGPG